MARTESMAVIDSALKQPDALLVSYDQLTPPELPGLTADQKRAVDADRQARLDEEAREEKQTLEEKAKQEQMTLDEAQQLKQMREDDEKRRSAFEKNARATVQSISKGVKSLGEGTAKIPIPGGIALPLFALIIFFILLVPVNGHTRFTWLWLVLTGNATIETSQPKEVLTSGGSTSGSPGNTPPDVLGSGGVTGARPGGPQPNLVILPVPVTPAPTNGTQPIPLFQAIGGTYAEDL